ncbi:ribonuclease HII [Candidatus Falkowbacteria bacterium]|nr:MAG: ribonuclease HII [Candidatus Falkowbacteria bacterium]
MIALTKEKEIFKKGYLSLGGIDEAGRGPLAGPVVAACVVIDSKFKVNNEKFYKINDSKKLTAKKREELYEIIINNASEVGVGVCDHKTIDRINILQATFLAMKKAISTLKKRPEFLVLDGSFQIPNLSLEQEAIIKGDELVFTIAAASIIAKVERDRIMEALHNDFPQYSFDKHKGYGTKLHMENLKKYGPSPVHRVSFKPVKILLRA